MQRCRIPFLLQHTDTSEGHMRDDFLNVLVFVTWSTLILWIPCHHTTQHFFCKRLVASFRLLSRSLDRD